MPEEANPTPIILCPSAFERQQLARHRCAERARIVQPGVGPEAMVTWAESTGEHRGLVILAGLAGALREGVEVGRAYVAANVIASSGRQYAAATDWLESIEPRRRPRRAVIASTDKVLTTAEEKHAKADRAGAELVDLESGVFAEAATILGWRWVIVRGVSDGHRTSLPPDIGSWVKQDGSTRPLRAIGSMLRRPWCVPTVLSLRRNAITAMHEVADVVAMCIDVELNPKEHS